MFQCTGGRSDAQDPEPQEILQRLERLERHVDEQLQKMSGQISMVEQAWQDRKDRSDVLLNTRLHILKTEQDSALVAVSVSLSQKLQDVQERLEALSRKVECDVLGRLQELGAEPGTHEDNDLSAVFLQMQQQQEDRARKHDATEAQVNDIELRVLQLEEEGGARRGVHQFNKEAQTDMESVNVSVEHVEVSEDANDPGRDEKRVIGHEVLQMESGIIDNENAQEPVPSPSGLVAPKSQHTIVSTTSVTQFISCLPAPTYCLEKSVWDSAIFIGLPGISFPVHMMLVCIVTLNAFAQGVFCVVIGQPDAGFTTSGTFLTDHQMKLWRARAHEAGQVDAVTGVTLVARVCSGDGSLQVANSQTDLVTGSQAYLSKLPSILSFMQTGPTLFSLSWLLWFLCVSQEFTSAVRLILALCAFPPGDTQLGLTNDGCRFVSLSRCRFVFMLVVTCMRLAVCSCLFIFGSLWLANTIDIQALVLNAAALGFVMELDEMLYVTMPQIIQHLQSSIEPLPLPQPPPGTYAQRIRLSFGIRTISASSLGIAALIWLFAHEISSNNAKLDRAMKILCGGNQDFSWGLGQSSRMLVAQKNAKFGSAEDSSAKIITMAEQLWSQNLDHPDNDNNVAFLFRNQSQFRYYSSSDLETLTTNPFSMSLGCNSATVGDDLGQPKFFLEAVRKASGVPTGIGCDDFVQACGGIDAGFLREQCPSQCGCDNPLSGLYLAGPSMGCPRDHCKESLTYRAKMSSISCHDEPLLNDSNPAWVRYWNSFAAQDDGFFSPGPILTSASATAAFAIQGGCASLLSNPVLYETFCSETPAAGSVAAFCPISCGCRRNPDRPGCPPSCRRFSTLYETELAKLPCCDVSASSFSTSQYNYTAMMDAETMYFQKYPPFVFQNVFGYNGSAGLTFAMKARWNDAYDNGCSQYYSSCGAQWGPFDMSPFCPQTCGCATLGSGSTCPGTCGQASATC